MGRVLEYVGVRRIGALLIDLFLASVMYTLLVNAIPETFLETAWIWHSNRLSLSTLLYGLILILYFLACDLFNGGNSLGKDILRLRTTGPGGETLCLKHRLVRTLLKLIGIGMLPVTLLLFICKGNGFTLQDHVLGSTVTGRCKNGFVH